MTRNHFALHVKVSILNHLERSEAVDESVEDAKRVFSEVSVVLQ